jgi:hypothetical protein
VKFSSEEANELRKAMATFVQDIETAGQDGQADGRARRRSGFAQRFDQIKVGEWLPKATRRPTPRLRVELAR